ncbi:J domain-containing protein required for chloroplast accumulation response 1 [Apostasia shenzhenica]|uniref:J domain-containing protein required for chloroplast accumulation response 1 n=1 Tax=Apostasia shenzhenica TaxID=1088818 RepID=A0A2I0AWL4_9ASPA|nr:J domain-containing protein required for chloroplast accumulation response 1 [Apostasia shenzhenica]
MERISDRERILLGYAPRDPFGGVAASSPCWNSDVDFQDVFGGPPRRSSLYEYRGSCADSVDLYRRASGRREDLVKPRRSHLQSGEKPVFGDASSLSRRRHMGDDFYDDIFQTSESACSSPRRFDRDPSLSSPNSRVLSPNRSTQLRCESLFGGSSLPAQLSLSAILTRGMDHAAPGSPTQSSLYKGDDGLSDSYSSLSSPFAASVGFAARSIVGFGDPRHDGHSSYRYSPLSCRVPHSYESWPDSAELAKPSNENKIEKSLSSLEANIGNDRFHFSIYKWAGKGVTLVVPSDSKDKHEYKGRLRRLPDIIIQEVELPPPFKDSSAVSKAFKNRNVTRENNPACDVFAGRNEDEYASIIAKEILLAESNQTLNYDMNSKSDKCEDSSEEVLVPGANQSSETSVINEELNPVQNNFVHGHHNPELKSLSLLFDDDIGRPKNDDKTEQVKDRDAYPIGKGKQQFQRERRPSYAEESGANMDDFPNFLEDKPQGSKVKGKVKEFMKKFNHEAFLKRNGAFDLLDQKSRGKDSRKVDEPLHSSDVKVYENSSITCDDLMTSDLSFKERSETLNRQTEPSPEVLENAPCNEEYVHEDIEGYLVQQLPLYQTELVKNGSHQDQIKDLDSKIRDWSKGKDGNIRSLLSTLQFILWPECGWKQVPLVDIIEGSSVRKAYQRAMLCLHPDKLQQKGASSNQKYIAEKVFDILQEAWDHFISISQF